MAPRTTAATLAVADLLRNSTFTDLRPPQPTSQTPLRALRALVRGRDPLVATRVASCQSARRHARPLLARRRRPLRRHRQPDRARLRRAAIRRPAAQAAWARNAWPASSPKHRYCGHPSRPPELLARLARGAHWSLRRPPRRTLPGGTRLCTVNNARLSGRRSRWSPPVSSTRSPNCRKASW